MAQPYQRILNVQSNVTHFTAPIGGLNAIDSLATMPATDAVQLDNLFPETTYIRLRRGSKLFCTLPGTPIVKSLMVYASATAGEKLLAAGGGSVYDISSGTATSIASGFTNDWWEWVNFSTPGGQFLIACNGTGKQWIFNGTTLVAGSNTLGPSGTPAPDDNTFASVTLFDQRLFFSTADSTRIYYLPVNVYQGELHAFDAGAFLRKGGGIASVATWTRDDATQGMANLLLILSTEGELLVYSGTNPDDPANWGMVGRFEIGLPVSGHRQFTRLGPDAMVICEDGFQPLAQYLAQGQSKALTTAISRKIGNAITQAVQQGRTLDGWCALLFPANNALIVNVPQQNGPPVQYVVNTVTGAWARYLNLPAMCWALFADLPYFGTSAGTVYQSGVGADDSGNPIPFEMVTAFQLPGGTASQKRATMCRPYFLATGPFVPPFLDCNVDYIVAPVLSPIIIATSSTLWNQFNWNQANWAGESQPQTAWYSVAGVGNAFAIHMTGSGKGMTLELMAFDLATEAGIGML